MAAEPKTKFNKRAIFNRINPMLHQLGLSGVDAAAYLGVSKVTLSKWNMGKVQAPRTAELALEELVKAAQLLKDAGCKLK